MILPAITESDRAALLAYMGARIGEKPEDLVGAMPYRALAIIRDGLLLAGVVFLNFRRTSIEFHLAGDPGWAASMPRADIEALFAYPFVELGCLRVQCTIKRNNKPARRGAEVLGFRLLGVAHDEYGPGKDGMIYSMRRRDCRWITGTSGSAGTSGATPQKGD